MLTIENKSKFLDLAAALSPENLHCDGEISRSAAAKKKRALDAKWAALEKEVGRKVSESETWDWVEEVRANELKIRQALIDSCPKHPLLESSNPGVWSRKGANGMSAYYIQNSKYRGSMMINGVDLNGGAKDEFRLYSEFGYVFNNKEEIGTYASLGEAVDAAEAFLKTVTREAYMAARPQYRAENIERELRRLPA